MAEVVGFVCSCCGERHQGLPALVFGAPSQWSAELADIEPKGNQIDSDRCMIGGEDFFIRCVLLLPIVGTGAQFGWGVWVSQNRANFELYSATFHDDHERITFGWLANRLPFYPDTLNLPTNAHRQPDGDRPRVEILPSEHPLHVDYRRGITMERAIAFAELALHPRTGGGPGRLPM